MLSCKCGWLGVNLMPNHQTNTAHCPSCSNEFTGITSDKAVATSANEENRLVTESKTLLLMAETLFPPEIAKLL